MPYLSSHSVKSELLCSTPADCLIEGRRRPISTIPRDNFFARTQKLNELRLPDGFSKKLKPLAATANYYGAGRPAQAHGRLRRPDNHPAPENAKNNHWKKNKRDYSWLFSTIFVVFWPFWTISRSISPDFDTEETDEPKSGFKSAFWCFFDWTASETESGFIKLHAR